jgi:hypothetical protein
MAESTIIPPDLPVNDPQRAINNLREFFAKATRAGGFITTQQMVASGLFDKEMQPYMTPQPVAEYRLLPPTSLDVVEQLYPSSVTDPAKAQAVYKSRIIVDWNTAGSRALYYEVELWQFVNSDWVQIRADQTPALVHRFDELEPGAYEVRIRAVGAFSYKSRYETAQLTLYGKTAEPQMPSAFACYVEDIWVKLVWTAPDVNVDPDVAGYIIKEGTEWNNPVRGVSAGRTTEYRWEPSRSGTLDFMIKSVDTSGRESLNYRSASITLQAPGTVPDLKVNIIDNNVLLSWSPAPRGDYPVKEYEIRRGNDFNTAMLRGSVAATFAQIFETAAGQYKYWVRAVDGAGLAISDPLQIASIYGTVSQPPDYQLISDILLPLGGATLVNAAMDSDGSMVMPINTTQTWQQHFESNGWNSPADQEAAGYPVYCQPGPATASCEIVHDYGGIIASGKITMDVTRTLAVNGSGTAIGSVTIVPTISYSADNSAWSTPQNVYELYGANFRYVKYKIALTAVDNAICKVLSISAKIDAKKKDFEKRVTIPGGVGYLTVYLTDDGTITGKPIFVDVKGMNVTPKIGSGSVPLTGFYDFVDSPNPVSMVAHVRRADNGAIFASDAEATVMVRGV